MSARAATRELVQRAAERGLRHVLLGLVDWDGRLRAKHYSTADLADALMHGVAMTTAIFAQDPADQPILFGPFEDGSKGYPDGRLICDAQDARGVPFEHDGHGLLVLGAFDPPFAAYCPRAILARELAHWASRGLRVRGGYELEFRLLDETPRALAAKSVAELAYAPGFERMYGVVDQAAASTFLTTCAEWAERMGAPIASLHHEFKGLIEAALAVDSGMAIADNALMLRTLAAVLARRDGRLACFMARVAPQLQSAGAHLNLSLAAASSNAFADGGPDNPLVRAFIAGLQRYLPELFVLCVPTVNSYKRFTPDCIAPLANSWGVNNKTVAYRLAGTESAHARIEVRVPGADVNPHLALAAVLAAGRAGVDQKLEPSAACNGDAAAAGTPAGAPFPRDLAQAVAHWRASTCAAHTFGGDFVDAYARSREWQLHCFARAITDWELQNYARNV